MFLRVESRDDPLRGCPGVKSRLGSEERGARNGRPAFSLPPSPFRLGITLTEVLISMGILTVGLLGVMAMFPVGGYYMQRGDVANRASAFAQAAFNDAVARGLLNPQNWYVPVPFNAPNSPNTLPEFPNNRFSVDVLGTNLRSTYRRPFAAALAEALAVVPNQDQAVISKQFGSAYVLDPMGVASYSLASAPSNTAKAANRQGHGFPATSYTFMLPVSVYASYTGTWNPWRSWENSGFAEDTWPIRRVTFHQPDGSGSTPMQAALAEELFSGRDDLAMDVPDQGDAPSTQNWDVRQDASGDPIPLARQARGDYSWIITVAPRTIEARSAMASGGGGHEYDVSVVVFYKRALSRIDPVDPTSSNDAGRLLMQQERAVRAQVASTGLSGGELLLTAYDGTGSVADDGLSSPFTNLKVGEWLMLCGPHPDSTELAPHFVMNWYRVLAIEGKDTKLDNEGKPTTNANEPERRLVALRGPQWPWQPNMSYPSSLSNYLCVAIVPGAVAVHNKTIQLETDAAFGGIGGGGAVIPPPTKYTTH